jgi:hypothetical protein
MSYEDIERRAIEREAIARAYHYPTKDGGAVLLFGCLPGPAPAGLEAWEVKTMLGGFWIERLPDGQYHTLGGCEEITGTLARCVAFMDEWLPAPACPSCAQPYPLYATVDPDAMDGDGPHCGKCWRGIWEHGRMHMPEAWARAVCSACGDVEEWDCVGFACGCERGGVYVSEALPTPQLRPATTADMANR